MANENEKLIEFFDNEWQSFLENNPETATFLGDDRYNDLLSDISLSKITDNYESEKKALANLESINREELTDDNKLNFDLYKLNIENSLKSYEYKEYLMPIDQMSGIQVDFSRFLSMTPLKTKKDLQNYLSRLNLFPKYIDQTIDLMREGIKKGYTVPKAVIRTVPDQISSQTPDNHLRSTFYSFIDQDHIEMTDKNEISTAVTTKVYPAFNKLKEYLEQSYIPNCRDSYGLSDLPNGLAMYEYKMKTFTTTDLSAEEVHEIGLNEVERITEEIKKLIKGIGFDNYKEFSEHVRYFEDFYFKKEEDLLSAYRNIAKKIDKELPAFFRVLPRIPYGVEKIPDYQAPSYPTAYYMQSDSKMSRAGVFYANTHALETRPKYEMEALTLHEGVPGHHLQISLALELENLPEFRKTAHYIGYIEGWGLYSEKLGKEMGFYKDPYSDFGRLSFEMWRACRLVLDTGLHAFEWSRERAINYLMESTGKSEEACAVEIDRYMAMPGQATSYKIGELKIIELRKRAEAILRDKFDIREFHNIVLKDGALPLEILEKNIDNYIISVA